MHRDMDLFRNILFEVEKLPPDNPSSHIRIDGHSNEEVCSHVKLASDTGFIVAKFLPGSAELRWNGSPMRDMSSWIQRGRISCGQTRKDAVQKATGTLAIDGLKVALGALIHQAIKGRLGQ